MKIKGKVKSVSVFGDGLNSAELQVRVKRSKKPTIGLRVGVSPAAEPQVFTSICTLVSLAYAQDAKAEFTAVRRPNGALDIVGVSLEKS